VVCLFGLCIPKDIAYLKVESVVGEHSSRAEGWLLDIVVGCCGANVSVLSNSRRVAPVMLLPARFINLDEKLAKWNMVSSEQTYIPAELRSSALQCYVNSRVILCEEREIKSVTKSIRDNFLVTPRPYLESYLMETTLTPECKNR
jgi:hypothetical protein